MTMAQPSAIFYAFQKALLDYLSPLNLTLQAYPLLKKPFQTLKNSLTTAYQKIQTLPVLFLLATHGFNTIQKPFQFFYQKSDLDPTYQKIQNDPKLSAFFLTQTEYGLSYFFNYAWRAALASLISMYFGLDPSTWLGFMASTALSISLIYPVMFNFLIKQLILSTSITSYITPDFEEAEIIQAPFKEPAPLKDWIALNLTHLLLLKISCALLNPIFKGVAGSLATIAFTAYINGFLLWQYAFLRDGHSPKQTVQKLTANPFETIKIGIIPALLELALLSTLWTPIAASLYAMAWTFAMIYANDKFISQAAFSKITPALFDPIHNLWNLNHLLFDLFKGPVSNPNLGELWAKKIIRIQSHRLTKTLIPVLSSWLWLSDSNHLNSLLSDKIFFVKSDLNHLLTQIHEGILMHAKEITWVQTILKTPLLKNAARNLGRAYLGNSLTQAFTFVLMLTTPEKIHGLLTKATQQLLTPIQEKELVATTSQRCPMAASSPVLRSQIQSALETPLSHSTSDVSDISDVSADAMKKLMPTATVIAPKAVIMPGYFSQPSDQNSDSDFEVIASHGASQEFKI